MAEEKPKAEKPAEKKKEEKKAAPKKAKPKKFGYKKKKSCPKCGHGVNLADHNDRLSCGRCGYMEAKRG